MPKDDVEYHKDTVLDTLDFESVMKYMKLEYHVFGMENTGIKLEPCRWNAYAKPDQVQINDNNKTVVFYFF
jgi:hypothetical protein